MPCRQSRSAWPYPGSDGWARRGHGGGTSGRGGCRASRGKRCRRGGGGGTRLLLNQTPESSSESSAYLFHHHIHTPGVTVGPGVGDAVGPADGEGVGLAEGPGVGAGVGVALGSCSARGEGIIKGVQCISLPPSHSYPGRDGGAGSGRRGRASGRGGGRTSRGSGCRRRGWDGTRFLLSEREIHEVCRVTYRSRAEKRTPGVTVGPGVGVAVGPPDGD
jgi:hypothetical protein